MERDKLQHFSVALGITLVGAVLSLYNDWGFIAGVIAALGFSIGKEAWDARKGGTGWSWRDLYADYLGISVGACVYAAGVFLA